jgi:hypothetical protein
VANEVVIDYRLGQYGWSQFKLTVSDASTVVSPFGYCTDALGDLVRAALTVATTGCRTEVSFDGEPQEWRLVADRDSPWNQINLRVLSFDTLDPHLPDWEGEILLEARSTADSFARAVRDAAQAVWDEHGAEGYNAAWQGPCGFPLRALTALTAVLSVAEPPAAANRG